MDEQKAAVEEYSCEIGCSLSQEITFDMFTHCIPDSAEPPDRQLFEADLRVVLWLLTAKRNRETARLSPAQTVWRSLKTVKASFLGARLTVREAALGIGVSPNHLGTLFHDCTKLTFHQYLLTARMHTAANLLRSRKMSAKQVADTLRYSDASNFYRDFRRVFGVGPAEYLLELEVANRELQYLELSDISDLSTP